MKNASGQAVIVDERSGQDITDSRDEITQLMLSRAPGAQIGVVQDGDHVVLSTSAPDEGQVSLLLPRSGACPRVDVPAASMPIEALFPH